VENMKILSFSKDINQKVHYKIGWYMNYTVEIINNIIMSFDDLIIV